MDHISPSGAGAFLIFVDVDNVYNCGVARDAGTYRTVGTSFELGNLVDGSGVSTRAALLDSILHFFGIFQVPVAEENKATDIPVLGMSTYPNPFRNTIRISFQSPDNSAISLKVYDASGRLVKNLLPTANYLLPTEAMLWDGTDESGKDVAAGVYFVHLKTENEKFIKKIIKIQ